MNSEHLMSNSIKTMATRATMGSMTNGGAGLVLPRILSKLAVSVVILICTMVAPMTGYAAGDAAAGAQKAYTCLGCHGVKHYVNTYPTYHVPKIAGQHEAYLIAALQAYRGKSRSHASMQANANLLSDQDIADIAAYFAGLGGKKPENPSTEVGLELAQTCAACHGADGNSVAPTNPILAGQYKSYIKQALRSYKSGDRQNPIMTGFAAGLSDADIGKLAEYFSDQKGNIRTAPR